MNKVLCLHEKKYVGELCRNCYERQQGYRDRQKEYRNRPEIKARIKQKMREYHARPDIHAKNEKKWRDPIFKRAQRNYQLLRNYGITIEDYERMLKEQNGVCAICGRLPLMHTSLHVDHNHETKKVRGLLCDACNRKVIGVIEKLKISLDRLREYLT